MQQFNAFTSDYPGEASSLQTQCGVCAGVAIEEISKGKSLLPIKTVTAIWDTGAEISAISTRVATELGLTPVNVARNITAAGEISVYIYAVNIFLPNNVNFAMVPVTGNDLGDVDMLIGMDIISKGDFSVTNVDGKTTFSFRIPSMERIDYVKEATPKPKVKAKEPGRNDPCPCGSGLKYKKCCGKNS